MTFSATRSKARPPIPKIRVKNLRNFEIIQLAILSPVQAFSSRNT